MIYNSVDVRISVKGQVWWGRGGGGIRTPRSLPMDPRLQLKCLSFVTHGEDLPEILVKPLPKNPTNSTYGWYASFKNAWVFPGISLVPRRPLLPHCPREVWESLLGDVTAHGKVQDWPNRERLGTRLPRDNKGSGVMSTIAKCRDVTYHPVSSLSSFSFSFSLSSSWSPSSSLDWKSLAWKSASSVRFYMKNQVATKVSSHAWVGGIWSSRWVSWHAGYQHTTINKL